MGSATHYSLAETVSAARREWWHLNERAKDHSLDAIAKRFIAVGALALCITGSMPLLTTVRGQEPNTQLEWEVKHLRDQMAEYKTLPTDVALILAHQRLEDERWKQSQDFQDKLLWGFAATAFSILLGLATWALNQFGVSIGPRERRRAV